MEAARREAQARRAVLLREERQERAERARLARVARERQQERLLLAKLDAELGALDAGAARMQRTIPRVKSNLEESVRDLGQFRGVLQKAIAEFGADASGLHPFVKTAQRYAGTPYVWGGESRTGFDCSGFIIRVMRDLGYKALPHSAAEQFNYGAAIARGVLKPGDLVFFKNTYKRGISHVGIYLGRNRFIHAAGPARAPSSPTSTTRRMPRSTPAPAACSRSAADNATTPGKYCCKYLPAAHHDESALRII
jgi:cell wall-associated NlpC family hydrolase